MSDIHLFQKLPTPIGDLTLVANEIGLRAVLWPNDEDRISLPMELLASDADTVLAKTCLLYTSPSPRDRQKSRMPSSA